MLAIVSMTGQPYWPILILLRFTNVIIGGLPVGIDRSLTIKTYDTFGNESSGVVVLANSVGDIDMDGMADAWEMANFGTLDRNGTGDLDGDGISDLEEYLAGTDPTEVPNQPPAMPTDLQPVDEVTALTPELLFTDSIDPDNDPLTYNIQVFSGPEFNEANELVTSVTGLTEQSDATGWTVDLPLEDNTPYWWRVQADDGQVVSGWATGSFFVNTSNDSPGQPQVSTPSDLSEVATLTPDLEVTNSTDVDNDSLTYVFTVYADDGVAVEAESPALSAGANGTTSWTVTPELVENSDYLWRVTVTDEHGLSSSSSQVSFFVNLANDAPGPPAIIDPVSGSEVTDTTLTLLVDNGFDPDLDELTYFFELDTVNTFDSQDLQVSPAVTEGTDQTGWDVLGLTENTMYYWRVRVNDGTTDSAWATSSFFVNQTNDPPPVPALVNPADGSWVANSTPLLQVGAVSDPDGDTITYEFEVYSDNALSQLVAEGTASDSNWTVSTSLDDDQWYYWLVRAVDEHGLAGDWLPLSRFFVDANGVNDTPTITMLEPATDQSVSGNVTISWDDADPDSNAQISLYYDSDGVGEDGVLIAAEIPEDDDGAADTYSWDVSSIPEGTYHVYAVIDDGNSSTAAYAVGALSFDRTAPVITPSLGGGVYELPQTVSLLADETANLFFTIDDAALEQDFTPYTAPVLIDADVNFRFYGEDPAGNRSSVYSESFVITDTDGDGMSDAWEISQFNDLTRDGSGDFDGDGITDLEELQFGTDPLADSDADADGIPDSWEIYYFDNLSHDGTADSDGDTFVDLDEILLGTHPLDADSMPSPPVADCGPDKIVGTDVPVSLNGSNSSSSHATIVGFSWQQVAGTPVTLTDAGLVEPTFISPQTDGALAFELTVTDAIGLMDRDTCYVNVADTNLPPIANAGPDQVVDPWQSVLLDGNGAYDPDGMITSYEWIQTRGTTTVTLSDATAPQPTFAAPDLGISGGSLLFQLKVTDDDGLQSTDLVNISVRGAGNNPPVANAGLDTVVESETSVVLDGSASFDIDGPIMSYLWSQIGGPAVQIEAPQNMSTSFIAPDGGVNGKLLEFSLTVGDGYLFNTDTVTVNVNGSVPNVPPVADAGEDIAAAEYDIVSLDGSLSYDSDDGISSYRWQQVSGTPVQLDNDNLEIASFTAPQVSGETETLVFTFTVTDYAGMSTTDTVLVSIGDAAIVIIGTEGDDTLTGGTYTEIINGLDGGDIISAGNGNNIVYGGAGNDTLSTGSGDDTVYGGGGDDIITDTYGSDTISGGDGNDTITLSGSGTDLVNGDAGNDTITLSANGDSIAYGDSGNDIIKVEKDAIAVNHSYTMSGGTGNDRLEGYYGTDTYIFTAGDGQDVISDKGATYGRTDTLKFGGIAFSDLSATLNGTSLVLSVANSTDSVTIENWNDPNYRLEQFLFDADSDGTYETTKGIADITPLLFPGSEGDDVIDTTNLPDSFTIDGGEGDDTITTGNANDNVNGSGGNDIITTNGGDDIVYGGGGNDTLSTGSGNDTVYGGDGDDIITDNSGSNTISGGGGNDTITLSGSGGTDLVNGDDGNDTITLSGHDDSIAYGGSGNDLITVTHYLAVNTPTP